MTQFLAALWTSGEERADEQQNRLRAQLRDDLDWSVAFETSGSWIACPATRRAPLRSTAQGSGVVIGGLFEAGSSRPAPVRLDDICQPTPLSIAGQLLQRYWGRYVALLPDDSTGSFSVFRDPSGGVECLIWRFGWLTLASSDTRPLLRFRPTALAVDWTLVGAILREPLVSTATSPLTDVHLLTPGALCHADRPDAEIQLWRPATFARRRVTDPEQALDTLKASVEQSVAAHGKSPGPTVVEISGGLDSAIVSSTLKKAADAEVTAWINFAVDQPGGDERAYAQTVAGHLGVGLTTYLKPALDLNPAELEATAGEVRPSFVAFDTHYDITLANECRRTGAARIMTGQGGDAVFYQPPSSLPFADHLQRLGLPALHSPHLVDVARWTRRSTWGVLRTALVALAGYGPSPAAPPPPYLSRRLRRRTSTVGRHPWLADLSSLPPAKRVHIRNLADGLTLSGHARRAEIAELIHPLLSQPVMEACLSIPVDILVQGGRDRALARLAFADRIPELILNRRSKGETNAYYGRAMANAVGWLRPYLLDGVLAANGLLDRPLLEATLSEEHLAWHGGFADLGMTICLEAWARRWSAYLAPAAYEAGPS
ncbi:asparagine synthase C-terminal domain-containing protein [Caulobacter sp. S45]|uniref:asparagine synthase-related protein n=1 Tax=Caulobacter sp. S45 TaxID=1641861 RepID=UPI00131B05C0|nr:asparagine synthase C-terminal domain-containing protein [Caulobacter sp. S45]